MQRTIKTALVISLILSLLQCSSNDKIKIENNRKIIKEASINKKIVSLYLSGSSANTDNALIGFVTVTDSFNGIFDFKYLITQKEIKSLKIKKDIDSASIISNEEKLKLSLPDNSFLIGSIASADPENNSIVFATQHQKYTVPKSKIRKLQFFNTSYVKVIFVDGSSIFGTITKDDGEQISLNTIFGDVSYSRNEINRIEYIQ